MNIESYNNKQLLRILLVVLILIGLIGLIGVYVFYQFSPREIVFISKESSICSIFNKKAPCKVKTKEITFYSDNDFVAVDCNNAICRINRRYIIFIKVKKK